MNLTTFKAKRPEFKNAPDPLVQGVLDETLLEFNVVVWGDLLDTGHMYLTAHKLSLSPAGQQARIARAQNVPAPYNLNNYGIEYWRLLCIVSHGYRVSGKVAPCP